VLVALLVVAAGGWGAWHLQQRAGVSHAEVAGVPASAQTAAAASTVAGASAVQATAASAAKAASTAVAAASTPQAATIIADDSDSNSKDSKASLEAGASTANVANAVDDNRLSRALANGADVGSASSTATDTAKDVKPAVTASAAASHAHHEHEATAARAKHETREARETHDSHGAPANRHANQTALAQARKDKQHAATSATASKDDPDADLLAALVARTKPADTKPNASGATTRVSASANGGDPKLAERVKDCGTRGFFEDQLCRWRVCDGHWGKDPACPGTAPRQPQP
jgi:hypothetical protein